MLNNTHYLLVSSESLLAGLVIIISPTGKIEWCTSIIETYLNVCERLFLHLSKYLLSWGDVKIYYVIPKP